MKVFKIKQNPNEGHKTINALKGNRQHNGLHLYVYCANPVSEIKREKIKLTH